MNISEPGFSISLLRTIWVTGIFLFLCIGAVMFLRDGSTFRPLYPSAIMLMMFVALEAFQELLRVLPQYDIATILSFILIAISLFVFYLGLVEPSADKKMAMLTFAGTVFGLGSGIPFGKLSVRLQAQSSSAKKAKKPAGKKVP